MRKLVCIAIFAFLAVVEFRLIAPALTSNPARSSYRRNERVAALRAVEEHPSPEAREAFRAELKIESDHEMRQKLPWCIFVFVVFLTFDGVCVYFVARSWPNKALHATAATPGS